MLCRRHLKQAIGNWWVRTQTDNPFRNSDRVALCRSRLLEMAIHQQKPLKTSDVARAFQISRPTALLWLRRFVEEGVFISIQAERKVVGYRLRDEYIRK
ncbi:hypothetical protein [Paenibacillus sp.]|uniref:hypothetical protein n=1 Tax=Paenibacillus sp. TaxID=58172 RepID=UPI002D2B084A|nr:hypothetical protein [Paenibacillus sp.]HZG86197.1 hypothetical protein [Paenibacillus sp.]